MKKLFLLIISLMVMSYVSAQLPVVRVVTDGPIVNTPAVHGTISVRDTDGSVITMHAGFKIRGTSSQQWEKKSYRVELWSDAIGTTMMDTTFLGMRSDDDWNLEAMYNQPLRLRNKVANDLWHEMYTLPYQESEPDASSAINMKYVDLYVNDVHVGLYTLTERVDRKMLGLKKFNGSMRGVLYKGNGEGNASFEALPAYNNDLRTWDQFEWVYPNEEEAPVDWSSIYSFVNFVMNASDNAFYSQFSTMFEVDNAVDYFIFINVLRALDNMDRNTFIARYKKTSPYFYVPWDLDATLGNTNEGSHNDFTYGLRSNGMFDRLLNDCSNNGYVAKVQQRYNALRTGILSKNHIMEMIQSQYNELLAQGAYDIEHEAWPEFEADASEIDYISDWLDRRFNYLDATINYPCGSWEEDEMSDNGILVFPNPAQDRINIRLTEPTDSHVFVYDMMGRCVTSANSNEQAITIDMSSFAPGIYNVVVRNAESQHVERVVVEE